MDTPSLSEGKEEAMSILGGASLGVMGDVVGDRVSTITANQVDPDGGVLSKSILVGLPVTIGTGLLLFSSNNWVRSVGLGMGLTTVRNGADIAFDFVQKNFLSDGSDESDSGSDDSMETQDTSTNGVQASRQLSNKTVNHAGGIEGGYASDPQERSQMGARGI